MALEHLMHAARARGERRQVPHGPRVLVVDPNVKLRRAALDLLRRAGLTAAEAADAGGALCALREWHPTVAVIELRLRNGRTGIEALRQLRRLDDHLQVVITAAATDVALAAEARRAGAFAVVHREVSSEPETGLPGGLVATVCAAHHAHRPAAAG